MVGQEVADQDTQGQEVVQATKPIDAVLGPRPVAHVWYRAVNKKGLHFFASFVASGLELTIAKEKKQNPHNLKLH